MPELKPFDRVAEIYDETRGMPPEVEARVAGGMAAILRELGPSPRLMEIGIGTGRIAAPLAARGVRVAGADIAPLMLAKLRAKRRDIGAVLAEASRPPFRDGAFDGALFVHILHLVPDVEATVRAAMRVVRPGGFVIYGADESREGIRDRAEAMMRAVASEVSGVALTGWKPYEESEAILLRILGDADVAVTRRTAARWTATTSARKMLTRLERRDFSSAWAIPEAAMPEILRRVAPEFEALFGGMETEREYPRAFGFIAGRLPG
jgi:ubiquinone/menaquinone biosynthesis C-methylase UbiE